MMKAWLLDSVSGRELCERGFTEDVTMASQTDVSNVAPMLVEGAFRNVNRKTERLPQDFFGASLRPSQAPPSHRNAPPTSH